MVYCHCLSRNTSDGHPKPDEINPKSRKPLASIRKQTVQKRSDTSGLRCSYDSPCSERPERRGHGNVGSRSARVLSLSFPQFAKFPAATEKI